MRAPAPSLAVLLAACGASHEGAGTFDAVPDARVEGRRDRVDAARPTPGAAPGQGVAIDVADAAAPGDDTAAPVVDAALVEADAEAPVPLDAQASDPEGASYLIGAVNGIGCCTFYVLAKSDPVGDYCAVVEFTTYDAVAIGDERSVIVEPTGTVFHGSDSCMDGETFRGSPTSVGAVSESLEGSIEVTPEYTFDVDLTLGFSRAQSWVPEQVHMRVLGLSSREGWRSE